MPSTLCNWDRTACRRPRIRAWPVMGPRHRRSRNTPATRAHPIAAMVTATGQAPLAYRRPALLFSHREAVARINRRLLIPHRVQRPVPPPRQGLAMGQARTRRQAARVPRVRRQARRIIQAYRVHRQARRTIPARLPPIPCCQSSMARIHRTRLPTPMIQPTRFLNPAPCGCLCWQLRCWACAEDLLASREPDLKSNRFFARKTVAGFDSGGFCFFAAHAFSFFAQFLSAGGMYLALTAPAPYRRANDKVESII